MSYRLLARLWKGLLLGLAVTFAARAEGERAGDFDYWVLALSWSPAWCALEGDARGGQAQCARGAGWRFALHGLWPQYEEGWPSFCRSPRRDPTRAETAAMADLMGSPGAAWYQWRKHGRCSGMAPADYFAAARAAFAAVRQPQVLGAVREETELPARVIEEAFVEANPGLTAAMITVTCREGLIAEVRLCLARDLTPRTCAPDAARDCRLEDAVLMPVR